MEWLKDILWPVLVVGGFGRFIDFLIGKAGQEKARDWLLKWWVRFDDVHWKNFGREEGLFAGRLIEQWLGRRIWSLRRIKAFIVLLTVALLLSHFIIIILVITNLTCRYCHKTIYYVGIALVMYLIGFSLSVSFTKFVTFRMAYLCGIGNVRNIIIFLVMLIVNCLMLDTLAPITEFIREWFLFAIMHTSLTGAPKEQVTSLFIQESGSIDSLALGYLPFLPSLFRFVLSIVFVGSFLMRPVVIRPVNLVWRRIVESDKPVFTVIFGGAAAFATAISEAAKHLSG